MIELRKTREFEKWFEKLRSAEIRLRILHRLDRLMDGISGDRKSLGHGVWELRFDFGPGYRVYYTQRGRKIILLLMGGDKSSQEKDIRLALKLARKE